MTGFAGLLLTSSTGPNATCTPSARPSSAVTRPSPYASAESREAPSAICIGKFVAPPSGIAFGTNHASLARKPTPVS